MQKIKNKIKQSNKYKKLLYKSIPVKVVDDVNNNVDVNLVLAKVEEMIPYRLLSGHVNEIIFGNFDFFKKRDYNAYYDSKNNIIYIRSEQQDDNIDLYDDIVHEISHAVENKFHDIIFSDGNLKAEFMHKRLKLRYTLALKYGNLIPDHKFMLTSFDTELDDLFHNKLGYHRMKKYVKDLFPSAYAPTSVDEYWAEGFEMYCLNKKEDLFKICPQLFKKIDFLFKGE
tara:strand:- start:41 stop:721 length:681 start_codon:yes stop_codon:yes gene_type:complete